MIEQILIKNGFSAKEAKVYLCVLQWGELPITRIATETHLKRTTIYSVIETLHTKGIISLIKHRGVQYIAALSPQILVDRFKKSAEMAESALSEMLTMAYSSTLKPRIKFFEGLEGIKQILIEFSYSKMQSMGFTDYKKMPKELFTFIRKEVIPERKKRNNRAMFIIPQNDINQRIQKENSSDFTEHRILRFPIAENPIEILLFEQSKIAFLSFEKQEMFGMIIDSSAIYRTLRNIFLLLWNNAAKN